MARISVTTSAPLDSNTWSYNVEVIESDGSGSKTNHKVTMNKDYYLAQTGGHIIPEEFVKKSWIFTWKGGQRFNTTAIWHYPDKWLLSWFWKGNQEMIILNWLNLI